MKKNLILAFSLALTPALFADGPADDVKAAAKKLAESGSYSWSTTTPGFGGGGGGGGGGGEMVTNGKTDKSGAASITTKFGDREGRETIIKDGKVAVKTEEGWKGGDELAAAGPGGNGGGGGGGQGRRGGGGGFAARMAESFKAPAAEVEALVTGAKDLKKDGDAITGEMTEEAVKSRLTFGGGGRRGGGGGGGDNNQQRPAPTNTKGTVKVWIKDGVLAQYEWTASGTVEGRDGQTRDIERKSSTEIKDPGTTKLEIPAEATAKLDAQKKTGDGDKKEEKKEDAKPTEKKKDEI